MEEIIGYLHNDNPNVRIEAITSLAFLERNAHLRRRYPSVRIETITSLAVKGAINTFPILIGMLDDKDQMVRLRATEALYLLGKLDSEEEVNFGEDKNKWQESGGIIKTNQKIKLAMTKAI